MLNMHIVAVNARRIACASTQHLAACVVVSCSLQPSTLHFLTHMLGLLPRQLAQLRRRTAAFALECLPAAGKLVQVRSSGSSVPAACSPAAGAAAAAPVSRHGCLMRALAHALQVHGLVLRSWMVAQLLGSERSKLTEVLRRVDTFLAANWLVYQDFVDELLHQVGAPATLGCEAATLHATYACGLAELTGALLRLQALPHEADAASREAVLQAASGLVCHMLLHLTDAWQPVQLSGVAMELLSTQPAAPLPSAASVLAPTALLAPRGQPEQQHAAEATDAAAVVHAFLRQLHECGAASWASLAASMPDTDAAGAALAVLYSSWQDDGGAGGPSLQPPATAIETVQVSARAS